MTDEEFVKKAEAFDFVDEIDMSFNYCAITHNDPYLDYDERIIADFWKNNGSTRFNEKLLGTINVPDRKKFIKLIYDFLLSQKSVTNSSVVMFYIAEDKREDFKVLVRKEGNGPFYIRGIDYNNNNRNILTKKDLDDYVKEEKFGPLSEFSIRIFF